MSGRLFAAACAIACAASTRAQIAQTWERVQPAGAINNSHVGRAVLLPDGSIVHAGTRLTPAPGVAKDVLLTRYSPDGTTLWSQAFGPTLASDTATDLSIDPSTGELLLVGATRAAGATHDDLRLSRFDVLGNPIWTTTWASAFDEDPNFVRADSSGAIWVVGRSLTPTPSFIPFQFLLGFTSAGAQFASVPMPTSYGEFGLAAHPSGGIAFSRDVFVTGSGTFLETARVDSAGNVLWLRSRPAGGPDIILHSVRRLVCDAAGNVYVCGQTRFHDALVVKYDANGVEQWARQHDDGTGNDQVLVSLAVDSDGASVGVGLAIDWAADYDVFTFAMRCDPAGNVSWSRRGNPFAVGRESGYADVALDVAGNAVVVGYDPGAGNPFRFHGVVVRYDRDGTLHGALSHNAAASQPSLFMQCLGAGGGGTYVNGMGNGLLTARYHEQGVPFCVGDGSASACPCGNTSATYDQAGCRFTLDDASHLVDRGVARVAGSDTFVLEVRGAPPSGPVIFVQGDLRENGGAGVVYGDGLLCIGGALDRLATATASGGIARIGLTAGTFPIRVLGHVGAPGTRTYQAFHRSPGSFCTPATMATSNGLEVTWAP